MRYLRQNTAVIVTVGPFYDKTDGVTIENALTATNERITLTADTDNGSAPTLILDNITGAAASTENDIVVITNGDAGLYQMELAAADTNRVGRMFLSITDAANHVPVFHEFFVLPQAIYDWFTGVIVPLPANVTQLLGTAWLTPGTAGTPDVNAKLLGGTAQTGRDIGASVLLSTGTGTGQLDFTSGVVKSNLAQILGTALTETAGLLAGGFKKLFNVATPTGTLNSIPDAVAGATGGLFIAGTNAATTVTTALTTTFTGNLTGSVASVTGAVGSVTGAVGSVTGGATALGVTASERNVRQTVESQRGHHTGAGAIFYVQKGGSDVNPGTYLLPFLTIQAALNACTANAHDTVIVLGVAGQAPSVFDEALTMSKQFVFLRGMGKDTQITRSGAASTNLTISANGCEVSGLWVNNTGSGATVGINTASGSDFAWLHDLFIDGAATGINITAGANTTIENCRINDCATTGVNVAQGAAVGLHMRILNNHIDGSVTGINFAGGDSSESVAKYNQISACTTGVVVAAGALKVQVTDNRFSGNTTDWTDAGTNTNLSWNALSTTIAGVIPLVTTLTTYTGNTPQTGDVFPLASTEIAEIYAAVITNAAGVDIAADIIAVKADTAAIKGYVDDIGVAGAGLTDLGGMSTTMKAQVETEVDDALGGGTGTALTAIPWNASWDAEVQSEVQDALDATVADSVPADGTRPSIAQALYMINQFLTERAVSGTTVTVKKVDGSTSLMTFTLNDGTTPTSITRAT
jgi:hypothetical protein